MAYNLIITEHADELLDELVYYLLYEFKEIVKTSTFTITDIVIHLIFIYIFCILIK